MALDQLFSGITDVLKRVEADAPQAEQLVGVVGGVLVSLIRDAEIISPAAARPTEEVIADTLDKIETELRSKIAGIADTAIADTAIAASAPAPLPATPPAPQAGGRTLSDADIAALASALKSDMNAGGGNAPATGPTGGGPAPSGASSS